MILRAFFVAMISVNIIKWLESRKEANRLKRALEVASGSYTTRDVIRLVSKLGEIRAERDASREMAFIWALFLIIYQSLN